MNIYAAIAGGLTWLALGLQFYITTSRAVENGLGAWVGITRYFGYFTVLTNLLVAIAFTIPLLFPRHRWGFFLARPSTRTAIAAYIIIVGITYALLLRDVWDPKGLQLFVHQLLHNVIPIIYVVFWLLFVPKSKLNWRYMPTWFVYPTVYLGIALLRGALFNWYPYPFLEVDTLGYAQVFLNSALLFIGFGILSFSLITVGRFASRMLEVIA